MFLLYLLYGWLCGKKTTPQKIFIQNADLKVKLFPEENLKLEWWELREQ